MGLHKLVERQLKRLGFSYQELPTDLPKWQEMIERVSKSYDEADQDRYLIERSMEISSAELQGLNKRLEESQHIARLGSWIYDKANEKVTWSKMLYEIFGMSATSAAPGYHEFLALVHESERDKLEKLVARAFTNGDDYELEMRIKNQDGQYRWYYIIAHPTPDKNQLSGIAMDINNRKQAEIEISNLHQQIVDSAHRAGMAEVATSILHNVGNILNSAKVSVSMLKENIERPNYKKLFSVIGMMKQNNSSLLDYLANDPKGKLIPQYLITVSEVIENEYKQIADEVINLNNQLEHIKDIVDMQQSLSGVSGIKEKVFVPELIDYALQISGKTFSQLKVNLTKEYDQIPVTLVDKSKFLQIMVNLIQNARDSVKLNTHNEFKSIVISLKNNNDNKFMITIKDNGVGIEDENLTKIFSFGFTTKKGGHGFGLHTSALAAKEMGGSLVAESSGKGLGASFILTLPLDQREIRDVNYAQSN